MSKPTTLDGALEAFVASKTDVQQKTRDNHRYRLNSFAEFLGSEGIDNVESISPYHVEQYKTHCRTEKGWQPSTMKNHVLTIRKFLRWCESIELLEESTGEAILVPNVSPDEEARDELVTHERAREIIDYLAEFQFASLYHVVFHTLYHTGMRRSAVIALDVEDWDSDTRSLSLRHRPAQGTQLKGGPAAERDVAVTDDMLASALTAWVNDRRPDVVDSVGRTPLFTSGDGRLHGQTVTKICYKVTRPCWYGQDCPHGFDPETCEYTDAQQRSGCPSAVSAHPMRRSAITNHLREDVSKDIVSERMSVSKDVLDQHYDERTLKEQRETRASRLSDKDV